MEHTLLSGSSILDISVFTLLSENAVTSPLKVPVPALKSPFASLLTIVFAVLALVDVVVAEFS